MDEFYGLLGRNSLMGGIGDALHTILCRAGQSLRMILAHMRVKYAAVVVAFVLTALMERVSSRDANLDTAV